MGAADERVGLEVDVTIGQARQNIQQLKDELKGLKNLAAIEIDPAKLKSLNKDIQEVEGNLKRATAIGKQGFDDLGNKVEKTSGGLGKMFNGLRTIANILPGIGLAGLVGFAIEPILNYISNLDILGNKLSYTEKILNDISSKAVESYAKEVTGLKLLVSEYNNLNTSATRKKEIQDSLQKSYPNYFADLDKHADKEKYIKEQVDKVTQSLIIQAKVQGAQSLLAEKFQNVIKSQLDPEKTLSIADRIKNAFSGSLFQTAEEKAKSLKDRAKENVAGVEEEYTKLENFITDFVAKSNAELSTLGGDPHAKPGKPGSVAKPKVIKEDPAIAEAKKLYEQLEALNNKHNLTLEEQERLSFFRRVKILQKGGLDITVAEVRSEADRAAIGKQRLNEQLDEENKTRYDKLIEQSQILVPLHTSIQVNQTQLEKDQAAARILIAEQEKEHKREVLTAIGGLVGAASELLGQQTAAGKAFAIASTLISTYQSAQKAYESQFAALNPTSPILANLAAAAAIIQGLARVKAIASVKVPGKGSFGGGTAITSSGLSATAGQLNPANQTNITRLDKNDIDALANQAVRAYVVESDVTNSQGRVQRIKRSAIFG